jgi:HEAT repeat protein
MPKVNIPLEILIQQLHSSDWTARCDAARLLGQSRDPAAVDALLPDLNDPDWRVPRNASNLECKRTIPPAYNASEGFSSRRQP